MFHETSLQIEGRLQMEAAVRMKKIVSVGAYNFHCSLMGNSTQTPVLFLHGFMGGCDEFEWAIAALCQTFYCIAVDLPGHGKTEVLGEESHYDMPRTAAGLIQLLTTLNIQTCRVVGYSMGGRLALYLAVHFPEHCDRAILVSASPGLRTQPEREHRMASDRQLIKTLETEKFSSFLSQWYAQPLFASLQNRGDFEQILARRSQNRPLELAKSLRYLGLGYQRSLWENLATTKVPLLLLAGALDQKFVAINTQMAALCKAAQLSIVSECGHVIHLEARDRFLEQIRDFLS
jgi:2-succinyl-6-hydroxy-2,4-cyclohexadiene-1-carboxylate synthase